MNDIIHYCLRDVPYSEGLALQHKLFDPRVECRRLGLDTGDDAIITLTHRPTYTLGRHAKASNIINRRWIEERGAEIHNIDRGGDITFHGPGQLVVYPIIDLQRCRLGVKAYVNLLEEAVILTLAGYGIEAGRVEGATGVWLGIGTPAERKICAIGIRCSRFITMHGLALNIHTDLTWFSAINPCGFTDRAVTSMATELPPAATPLLDDVAENLLRHLIRLLQPNR